jgi:hypothetical protein
MTNRAPFRYFKTSPEIIRLAVMLCIRFPLSLPNVDDLLHKRGIEISHETVRYWWNRFGPMLPHRSTRAWLALFAFSLGATSGHMSLVRESWVHEPFPPPFTVSNDGKNQSIPLINLDNSCPDRVWVAWGFNQIADQFDSLYLRSGWLLLLLSTGSI